MDSDFGKPHPFHQGGDGMDHYGTQEKVFKNRLCFDNLSYHMNIKQDF